MTETKRRIDFGQALYDIRMARGISQEGLAELLDVSRASVVRWESKGALPDAGNVVVAMKKLPEFKNYILSVT